jgi:hypothetical protein
MPLLGAALQLPQQATPANPAAGYALLYVKSDNKVYVKDSSGVESVVGTGAGGPVMQTGTVTITIPTSAFSASVTVTFTTGLFATAPSVVATANAAPTAVYASTQAPTNTSVVIFAVRRDGSNPATAQAIPVSWQAFQ